MQPGQNMRQRVTIALACVFCAVALLCGCATVLWTRHRGQQDAARDVQHGVLMVKSYGYPVWTFYKYQVRLQSHGIVATNLGCSPGWRRYVEGYNEVSERAIAQRYGSNFLGNIWQQAELDFKNEGKVQR